MTVAHAAVADIAVQLGPRNRRRLTAGGIGLVAITILVLAVALLTRPASHSGSASPVGGQIGHKGDWRFLAHSGQLAFGMTTHQVRTLVGPPSKTHGSCWEYQENLFRSDHGVNRTYNAQSLCFYGGKYSVNYLEMNGEWHDDNGGVISEPSR
ncbi:MAG TPA: hypothetical protein VFA97_08585 [Gaiellaceae bacterium]|nr:hypothetical protein [Gaiellaceae bacterium]